MHKIRKIPFFLTFVFLLFSRLYSLTQVEIWISEGSGLNNFLLYEDALTFLNKAIEKDPFEKEAYKERALSYFELNKIDLALKDYEKIASLTRSVKHEYRDYFLSIQYPLLVDPSATLDFAKGLLQGAFLGGGAGTVEFISSIRGGFTFLWAFACSPVEVSKDLIEALREMGELLASGNISQFLEEALPEIVECARCWNSWDDYTKGQKLGFIVGKYSITAFYYVTFFRGGAYFFNRLKRANIMATLERYSATKSVRMLEESAKHAKKSTTLLNNARKGAIVPHNPNVLPHIFTEKHQWNRFVALTGDHKKDFAKLAEFLENHHILSGEPRITDWFTGVCSYEYRLKMGNDTIVAIFDVNKENVHFLKNAWVEVDIPYAP
jgi:tetratricopeptide (TPR) repeat protein